MTEQVKDWPLRNVGDEKFFGYVVAMGVFPAGWTVESGLFQYVDFAYNNEYTRYRLPNDEYLKRQLYDVLWGNLNGVAQPDDIYGKVWIKRHEKYYEVALP